MNWAKVTTTPLRGLELARREQERNQLPNRQAVTGPEQTRRLDPLVAMLAHGQIPLDESGAAVVAQVLGKTHRTLQRMQRKK